MNNYLLWSGDVLFVKKLAAGDFCIFSRTPDGTKEEKIHHKTLPITQSFEAAQKNLDQFAASRSLEKVEKNIAS